MPVSSKPRKRHNLLKTARSPLHRRPHPFQAYRTFDPVYRLLDTLRTGEIDSQQGKALMVDWDGVQIEVVPALDGWICCWQRIIDGVQLPIDLSSLRQLLRYLTHNVMLTYEIIDAAYVVTDQCYQAYCQLPRQVIIGYSNTEQIAIELESLGVLKTPPSGVIA